jgi:hypothetical protein
LLLRAEDRQVRGAALLGFDQLEVQVDVVAHARVVPSWPISPATVVPQYSSRPKTADCFV